MGATSSNILTESHAIDISGKILVAAIIFLFMVVLFVILLHLYAQWFWWRIEEETTAPPPRRRRRRRFVFAPGQDPVINGTQQIGLDPAVLRSLPVWVFQPEDFKDGLECAVCLSEIVQGEKARLLPKCNHGFHVDCIDMWFQSHSTCPLCRNLVASESSKPNSSSNAEEDFSRNSESSEAENSAAMSGLDLESPNFPTDVLVWGNQTQVSSIDVSLGEGTYQQPPCSSSSTSSSSATDDSNSGCHGMLVIDIPSEFTSTSLSPSSECRCADDELKSPMTAKLRSLKRLLSRDKKLSPCSPSSMDIEQQAQS